MTKLVFAVALILLSGCTSLYNIGADIHNDNGALYRPVPRKVANEMKPFEEACINSILSGDVDKISAIANVPLLAKIKPVDLQQKLKTIKTNFKLTDKYRRVKLHNSSYWLDEMISQDPYKMYDFIAAEYEITGNQNIRVLLLIEKKPEYKLWGFSIHPSDPGDNKSELTYFSKEIKSWWTFGIKPYQWWALDDSRRR